MMDEAAWVATVRRCFLERQADIIRELERLDGARRFSGEDLATPGGGLSRPRVLQDGAAIEKAAVLFTHSIGAALPAAATERNPHLAGQPFQAVALSLIVHPRNPYVPTAHMNLRFFLVAATLPRPLPAHPPAAPAWHFGGGFDLTPHYPFEEDVVHWHRVASDACQAHGDFHAELKRNCDDYFFLKHHGEARGVGGIFFDDWTRGGFNASFAFVDGVGSAFLRGYAPIFARRAAMPWGEREEAFMLLRRGRYAEFNLAIDRGTRYGLQSGRRVESVLASLPPRAQWRYGWRPAPGSPEAELTERFLPPRDWLSPADEP